MAIEQVVVMAGGTAYSGWLSVAITAQWSKSHRSFDIQVTEVGGFGGSIMDSWPLLPGTPVTVLASGSLLIKGFVVDYAPQGDANSHTVTIRGEGDSRGYADCSCYHPTGQFEQKSILKIAQDLGGPFGVKVSAAQSAAREAAEIVPWFQIRRGSSPWAEMMRLLPQRGMVMCGQADGSIALMRCEKQVHAGGLIQGVNIQSMSALWRDKELYDKYGVTGQASTGVEDDDLQVDGEADGPGSLGQWRYAERVDQAETDKGRAKTHAKWWSLRAAGFSRQAEIVVPGFRDEGGRLWEPGWKVAVVAPWLKLEQHMMIEKVVFVQNSSEGTISRLSLVDPRAGGDSGGGGSMPNLSGGGWNVFGGK
jgi:prophage tail gpP-like protein